jgi:hypothetical protein
MSESDIYNDNIYTCLRSATVKRLRRRFPIELTLAGEDQFAKRCRWLDKVINEALDAEEIEALSVALAKAFPFSEEVKP